MLSSSWRPNGPTPVGLTLVSSATSKHLPFKCNRSAKPRRNTHHLLLHRLLHLMLGVSPRTVLEAGRYTVHLRLDETEPCQLRVAQSDAHRDQLLLAQHQHRNQQGRCSLQESAMVCPARSGSGMKLAARLRVLWVPVMIKVQTQNRSGPNCRLTSDHALPSKTSRTMLLMPLATWANLAVSGRNYLLRKRIMIAPQKFVLTQSSHLYRAWLIITLQPPMKSVMPWLALNSLLKVSRC